MSTPPSQGQAATWVVAPQAAFAAWLGTRTSAGGRPLRASSQTVYRGMFSALLTHLSEQGIALDALDADQINGFLAAREVEAHRRHRYLLLFSHLLDHLQAQGVVLHKDNAAHALLLADPRPEDVQAASLTPAEVERLLQVLAQPGRGGWRHRRLQALVRTLLHAGLRSGEVLALRLNDVSDQVLHVRARLPRPRRSVPVDPLLQTVLRDWRAVRQAQGLAGELVFPSNLEGQPIAASTLFRQIRGLLQKADIHSAVEGPALLRNTCAARCLATQPLAKVCRIMGYEEARSALRFAQAAAAWEGWAQPPSLTEGRSL